VASILSSGISFGREFERALYSVNRRWLKGRLQKAFSQRFKVLALENRGIVLGRLETGYNRRNESDATMWIDIFEHPSGKLRLIAKAGLYRRMAKIGWLRMPQLELVSATLREEIRNRGYILQRI
jgi:hypothetical protein